MAMKYILLSGLAAIASCATPKKNWDMPPQGVPAHMAEDSAPTYQQAVDTAGSEPGGLSDDELRELAMPERDKPWRFSGSLSVGVHGRL